MVVLEGTGVTSGELHDTLIGIFAKAFRQWADDPDHALPQALEQVAVYAVAHAAAHAAALGLAPAPDHDPGDERPGPDWRALAELGARVEALANAQMMLKEEVRLLEAASRARQGGGR